MTPQTDERAGRSSGDAPVKPHLSQVLVRGSLAFASGHVPLDADGRLAGEDPATQARAVLEGLGRSLASVGFGLSDIVATTVYLTSTEDFGSVNAVFAEFFPDAPPCRTTVRADLMRPDFKVEIDAIASREDGTADGR